MNQMSLTSNASGISPEERRLKNERNRVKGYIRSYERSPDSWGKGMVAQLERLAMQYQIPFKRQTKEASFLENLGAGTVGAVDSLLFDLVPDKWYSSEATRKAANYGKIAGGIAGVVGGIAAAIPTGGASLGASTANLANAARALGTGVKAATGAAGTAKALGSGIAGMAAPLGSTVGQAGLAGLRGIGKYTPLGATTRGAIGMAKGALQPYGAGQGWKWAEKGVIAERKAAEKVLMSDAKGAIKNRGSLEEVIKGKTITDKKRLSLEKLIDDTYGKTTKVGKQYMNQLQTADVSLNLKGLKPADIIAITNRTKGSANVTVANLKKSAKSAGIKINNEQAKVIVDSLITKGHKKFDSDAIRDIIAMAQKTTRGPRFDKIGLGEIDKVQGLGSLAAGGFALSPLASTRASREDLEGRATDPYDPYA